MLHWLTQWPGVFFVLFSTALILNAEKEVAATAWPLQLNKAEEKKMRGCIPVLLVFAAMVVTVVYGGLPGRFLPLERAIPLNNQSVELGYLTTESCKVWLVALSTSQSKEPPILTSSGTPIPYFLVRAFIHCSVFQTIHTFLLLSQSSHFW